MQDVIKKLSTEQALEVVKRLSGKGGKIQEAVLGRERGQDPAFAEAMDELIQQRCPNWAKYLLRTGGRT